MTQSSVVTFRNPVITGFNPDPTVCVVPATDSTPTTFFLSTSTFEFFPGCAIYTSTNLVDWTLIGHALTRRSQIELRTVEPGAGSWASTLRYRPDEKRWYLANGLFQRYRPTSDERIFPRGFYVWTDNIWDDKAWSDPVYFDNPGFDQDLFWDDDGKVYLSTTMRLAKRAPDSKLKDFAIHISEISLPTGRTLTPPVPIRESPHGIAEGSHVIKHGKYYYLFTAEGGTEAGHQEWVLRSRDGPYGPWEGQGEPLWYNGPEEEVQRTGHADVFEDGNGQWWAVFLGVRPVKDGGSFIEPQMGRETFLVIVEWEDDWPIFNGGKNITFETEGRAALTPSQATGSQRQWTADFSKEELELGWYQKNTPLKQCHSLSERPGVLRLYGNCFDLSSPEAPAMLLRKQTSYTQSFYATLDFNPRKEGYEAGVVVWWSQYSYAAIGVVAVEQDGQMRRKAMIREPGRPKDKAIESDLRDIEMPGMNDQAIEFKIGATPTTYSLQISRPGSTFQMTVRANDLTVAPPVGGCFAGVMFGVYSFGNGEPVLDAADFSGVRMEG